MIWLESETTRNLAAKYRNLDGELGVGYRKIPFSAADNIDFGLASSMTFDDATDSVTINKEGLYAFRFRSATLAGASALEERLPINVEINIIRGGTRMRFLDANGIAEAYESNGTAEVLFPAKVGDVVYAVAAYASGPGLNASMSMAKLGYLRNRVMSIVLVHPGPAGTSLALAFEQALAPLRDEIASLRNEEASLRASAGEAPMTRARGDLRPALSPASATAITLAAGIAVADAVQRAGVQAALKWPNDVLAGGR